MTDDGLTGLSREELLELVRRQQDALGRVSKAPVTVTRCSEAGVNRYFSAGCGGYGVAVAGDRVQRRLTETDARTRRSEWCQALYCEG